MALNVLGIRHHGPGSARSVARSLDRLMPDLVLVEGPPEGDPLVGLVASSSLVPPVALLCYVVSDPQRSAFWPFASFSPELAALRWAEANDVRARFCDLPAAASLAWRPPRARRSRRRVDPIAVLASAAGHEDPERWWEDLVEARGVADEALFEAVGEAMEALRGVEPHDDEEAAREAAMRLTVRAARKQGHVNIVVVCGAWHMPALTGTFPSEAADRARLKGLPRERVAATWVPWTTGRLAQSSGYGAGVASPGWYAHLHDEPTDPVPGWLARTSRVLRREGLDSAPAGSVDAARLAGALASLRGRPLPGLAEVTDATLAVLCGGDPAPLQLVHRRLVVGEGVGRVPDETPGLPLVEDVRRLQRRLRLPVTEQPKVLEIDLRQPTGLDRSHLLHRLRLLDIAWGEPSRALTGTTGTFRETWRLAWDPALEVAMVEASVWGTAVAPAATARAGDLAWSAASLPELTDLVQRTLLAELPDAVVHVVAALEVRAAVATDVHHLLAAIPPLVQALRYGTVRRTDAAAVGRVVDGMVARSAAGLAVACASLDDDAAATAAEAIRAADGSIGVLSDPRHLVPWRVALRSLASSASVHGLVCGRAARLLLDAAALTADEAARLLGRALSPGEQPARAGGWVEGFLSGSGVLLVHDDQLWSVLDRWVSLLPEERFTELLPLLRRTFSSFGPPERRALGDRAAAGRGGVEAVGADPEEDLEHSRADLVVPTLRRLLGL
ncbi:MAG: FIG01121542: hypothetical protein [uncultured Acidimicrobiales bacterium]|uniref:Uncharacterized protein n=1 Tax=uncultured Acidimicrobiales bacterium TaxID=310071 RepID=A0A6J4HCD7_9ACTN|nr:MAG: FIG01121542: hypothetical protein [uncultured Acidimicrobiales bacterium]